MTHKLNDTESIKKLEFIFEKLHYMKKSDIYPMISKRGIDALYEKLKNDG